MRALSAFEVVRLWENGRRARGAIERGVALLRAAGDARSSDELLRLPVGARDGSLLALRQATFGDEVRAFVTCTGCREPLEFEFRISEVAGDALAQPGDVLQVERDGVALSFRLPSSEDLIAAAAGGTVENARRELIARCVLSPSQEDVPDELLAAMAERILACDPAAEIGFTLDCPACGASSSAMLEIAELLWSEVGAHARRLFEDVDTIARHYHWTERDILSMSTRRRNAYLELVGT